jgi:hypothetical protein
MMVQLVITRADALTKPFSITLGGTVASATLAVDNGPCISSSCPAPAEITTYNGKNAGGIPNSIYSISGQTVEDITFVMGTGCLIAPNAIKSCTLNGSTDACEYAVVGGSFSNQQTGTTNLQYGLLNTGGTMCVDYSSFPYKFSATYTGTILGGTGSFAGNKGSFTETDTGLYTSVDREGHVFGSFTGTVSGSVTR